MEKNNKHISIDLITRFLSGETSDHENHDVEKWLQSDPANQTFLDAYKKVWESTGRLKQSYIDVEAEWKKLEQTIERIPSGKTISLRPKKSIGFQVSRIAAIALIVLISGGAIAFLANYLRYERIASGDQIKELTLPDGSLISMNKNSKIRYLKNFSKMKRSIAFTGEAFFDVARDTLRPFIINTNSAIVEVLGTAFNVNSYKENEEIEVVVASGKVSLSSKKEKTSKIVLKAGEKGILNKKKYKTSRVNTKNSNYLAWKTKKLVFQNESLDNVIATINKAYGSSIVIQSHEIRECRITATFDKQSLNAILTILENTIDITITRSENTIFVSGEGC